MKAKHNKKRNTAFLFEALVRELTKSIVNSDQTRAQKVKKIIKEHFGHGGVLFKELDCFNSLSQTSGLDINTAEKLMFHAKRKHSELNSQEVFKEQSKLIKKINTDLSPAVFNNFVPNYRSFATISQIFNDRTALKKKVLMEKQIIKGLTSITEETSKEALKPVDSLVLKTFASNYNNKYQSLLPEQRDILNRFVNLNEDNKHDFSLYLLSTLKGIEKSITESLDMEEIKEDKVMLRNTQRVLEKVENFNVAKFNDQTILSVLKLQSLVKEYNKDDN